MCELNKMQQNNYITLSNIELQRRIQSKDEKAFRELYNRYWDKVFVICHNRIHNMDVAQDIVQDIFMSLWNHRELSSIQNIESYLYQACKFAIIKEYHKSARYDSLDSTGFGVLDRVEDLDLDEVLEAKFLKDLLQAEVERLPEKTKIIFNYSRNENLNSREIAEKLNISPRTVENQLSKALKVLRKFVNNLNFFVIF